MYRSGGFEQITKERERLWLDLVLDYYMYLGLLGVIKVCRGEKRCVGGGLIVSCLLSGQIISTHDQEERKGVIELILDYYMVLGVIKLSLWEKRRVKIYLVWPSYFYFLVLFMAFNIFKSTSTSLFTGGTFFF